MGSSLYSVDYLRGEVIFSADTTGSAVYLYGRSYDLYAAAANVWRFKAANAAKKFDFSTDNHSFKRSQYMQHCKEMAQFYESQAEPSVISLYRSDLR